MPHEGNGGPAEGTAEARLRVRVAWSSLKASLAEQAGERGMQGQSIHPWRHRESDFKNYYFLKKDCIIYFYFLGVSVLPAPVTIYHVYAVPAEARRGSQIPPELELQTALSCHVGANKQTKIL